MGGGGGGVWLFNTIQLTGIVQLSTMDMIKTIGVVMYKIPSFSVLSFELKQVMCSVWDDAHDRVQHFDIFM